VIVGPDGAAWVTEGGQNAVARVDPATRAVKLFPLPKERRNANLNTAAFDRQGVLWFSGQNGLYGRLDPESGKMAEKPPSLLDPFPEKPPTYALAYLPSAARSGRGGRGALDLFAGRLSVSVAP